MKHLYFILFIFGPSMLFAQDLPANYTDLLPYVQQAPDQGDTKTCLSVASTGAMELIANKKAGIINPEPYGTYDLSEPYLIHAPVHTKGTYWWETDVRKFNSGFGIHINDWPFEAWTDTRVNDEVWDHREWRELPRVALPKVTTIPLFVLGDRWSTYVLNDEHLKQIKEAMWTHRAPVMINYNDEGFWHTILIVGWDDQLPGDCYQTPIEECNQDIGSFYVRDSFGVKIEVRDYDWLRVKANAAFLIKEDQ